MTVQELEQQLRMLKSDYARVQGDLEKIESIGGNPRPVTRQLKQLEEEIYETRQKIHANSNGE
ncbi:SE1832 family protein [Geomicrobium sp. JCM 19039]|uniref:SE1832 family protein n=1 Tax=Geomicrobium sp. JCM 19039 TaxID=1460636 RepID=UPI00045F1AA2|nr:SE1832 family protein [Geomicrobium sp. JCM 19039]GAK10682.1 hypothetical protein JCM19039_315 [Geomicrobium sp. JCM 19039]